MIFAKQQRQQMRDYLAIDASGHGWISLVLLLAFPFLLSARWP